MTPIDLTQLTDAEREAHHLLAVIGVTDPERWLHYGAARIRAAIYHMQLRQKGPGFVCWMLREQAECPPPPDWWNPFSLQTPADQMKERAAKERAERRAAAEWEASRQENAERWHNARPINDDERDVLHQLMDRLGSQMSAHERAVLTELREKRGVTTKEEAE